MKKLILSLFMIITSIVGANAQFSIAPELGLNMANMTLKEKIGINPPVTIGTAMKAGLVIGAIADLGLNEKLYVQPGVFYLMNGCNIVGGGTYNINTVEIPVNIVYKSGQEGGNRFYFGVGPYIGYNISGTVKMSGSTTTLSFG